MSLPLEGIRVLDLSRLLPGGFCSLLLADFGAEVLKVEDTGMGDYIRWSPPVLRGRARERAARRCSSSLNRNKRSIRLDLKNERGREALLRLVREYDVVLESFRPGVLDRLGVGYERMREENPGIVYCAITGYGQDGPKRDASGPRHELPRPDRPARADRRARRRAGPGRRADRRPRRRRADGGVRDPRRAARARRRRRRDVAGSGEGQLVDVSMADGALSWLAMVAGDVLRRRQRAAPRRAAARRLAGLLPPVRVRRRLGHARRARAEVLAGVVPRRRPRGPDREAVRAPRLRRARAGRRRSSGRARATQWEAFAREHDCCLEPVLELDEALDSELVRAREMVVELDQPGAERAGAPARHAGQARPHARRARAAARARRSASTPRRCCARPATRDGGDRRAARRAAPRPARPRPQDVACGRERRVSAHGDERRRRRRPRTASARC